MSKRSRWAIPLAAVAIAATALGLAVWLRGPEPEQTPPSAAETAAAGELLRAVEAFADGQGSEPAPPAGVWYVSIYPQAGGDPTTVRADEAGWAEPLRSAWPGRIQVDRAIPDPPPARPWFGGFGLDVGRDGWIEASGRVHLPVEAVLRGDQRKELAERMRESPGAPLRTHAWVMGDDGPLAMRRHSVDPGPLTAELLRERLRLAGDYLARHLREDGTYDYEWDARAAVALEDYSLLRHAGTTYSLFQIYRHTQDERHYQAARRALDYLRAQRLSARERCFVVEHGAVPLGGAGLSLLALVEQARARPQDADHAFMRCLAEHILHETDPDGAMRSFYFEPDRFVRPDYRVMYYPGEATLALARYAKLEGEARWRDGALLAARYLVQDRWVALGIRVEVPPDCWLIQALDELEPLAADPALADYAFAIGRVLSRDQLVGEDAPDEGRGGPIGPDEGSVLSAGARGEGFAAAARLERRLRPGETHFFERLTAFARFALRYQYTEPILFGLASPERALGGFRSSPVGHSIRIDGVQHNVSGLVGLLELLEAP